MHSETGKFRVLGTICFVLWSKNMQHYITYDVILSCKIPQGCPLLHSRYALLRSPDQTRRVVLVTTMDVDLFILNFYRHVN
jgi:hypothetical protein